MSELNGRRATVMGLGRHGGGVTAARFLAQQGAIVTVTDLADADALAEPLADLASAGIERFHLGGHQEVDFQEADLVVVNPAVRPGNPLVELARQSGAAITSEIELFLNVCPAPVIGVTGSNGKSTTAAMTAAILNAGGKRAWLGGNIGKSLLPESARIRPDDWVVLELSSFQLFWLSEAARWPRYAILTNCTPNHLDWHVDFAQYAHAKQRLIKHLRSDGWAVFDSEQPGLDDWSRLITGRIIAPVVDDRVPSLRISGRHNRRNAAFAAGASIAAGVEWKAVVAGLSGFTGLPHRLEFVAEIAGRQFINDSKATTPEASIAALNAMERPTWLLLGGSDKGANFAALAAAVGRLARGAAVYGAVGPALERLLAELVPRLPRRWTDSLDEAVAWCWSQSAPGDTVLLSPGCASFDQFRDYIERGERFKRCVAELCGSNRETNLV